MIELKEAIQAAMEFAREYLTDDPKDLALEEVQIDDTNGNWIITLGYSLPRSRYREKTDSMDLFRQIGPRIVENPREYKQFTIDHKNGKVLEMTIVKL